MRIYPEIEVERTGKSIKFTTHVRCLGEYHYIEEVGGYGEEWHTVQRNNPQWFFVKVYREYVLNNNETDYLIMFNIECYQMLMCGKPINGVTDIFGNELNIIDNDDRTEQERIKETYNKCESKITSNLKLSKKR